MRNDHIRYFAKILGTAGIFILLLGFFKRETSWKFLQSGGREILGFSLIGAMYVILVCTYIKDKEFRKAKSLVVFFVAIISFFILLSLIG